MADSYWRLHTLSYLLVVHVILAVDHQFELAVSFKSVAGISLRGKWHSQTALFI